MSYKSDAPFEAIVGRGQFTSVLSKQKKRTFKIGSTQNKFTLDFDTKEFMWSKESDYTTISERMSFKDIKDVQPDHESTTVFRVETTDRNLHLTASDEALCRKWLGALVAAQNWATQKAKTKDKKKVKAVVELQPDPSPEAKDRGNTVSDKEVVSASSSSSVTPSQPASKPAASESPVKATSASAIATDEEVDKIMEDSFMKPKKKSFFDSLTRRGTNGQERNGVQSLEVEGHNGNTNETCVGRCTDGKCVLM